MPEYTGTTWGDLAQYTARLQAVIRFCNGDKRLLREWTDAHAQ